MRYPAEQVDRLAAEYVLGTLHGGARRRFESLLRDRADVRHTVWRWERYLSGFASAIEPRRPPKRIWRRVRRRIERPERRSRAASWWSGLGFGLPVAAAMAWLAITLIPQPSFDRMAVFADQEARALWVINADMDRGVLVAETIDPPASDADTVYELWALPETGNPQSLGLLSSVGGVREHRLSPRALEVLRVAQNLAISIEPSGGSPTGLPTGPVVFQASVVSL